MKQRAVPCVVYRGGTSRGLFFKESDLPTSRDERNHIFMTAIDAYNPSQVNGLGSGTSHTSKVITVRPSERADACLIYTFYQVGIGQAIVDAEGTCGNLMAAVGAYAVDEGYAECLSGNDFVEVTVFNENIERLIQLNVPVESGRAQVEGDYLMPGLVHPGARVGVSILSPGGGKTGDTFPIGRRTELTVAGQKIVATFSDVVNPFVFVHSETFGYTGAGSNTVLGTDSELLELLETIRVAGAVASGMAVSSEIASQVPSIPKVALVSAPCDYVTTSGKTIHAEEVDIIARMISMGKFHRTFAGSGLYNLAAMTLLEGTVPHDCSRKTVLGIDNGTKRLVRIGHPDGVAEVMVELTKDGSDVSAVGLDRTARRIMDGQCYVPDWT
ncbi:PrpF protein [Sporosarcina sp. BI001-red]|uniref:PrpF domain-containing protein n=1 Tax=Sporosarcina sp. BI001-red TaxID=2282866 RepID=UPI000E2492E6|nr:PrpF domain-containing protein [Sporosarcina sp. BI001-red]REB08793.1 PrpF protein [Sporosarcina sp. BI001-red]